MRWIFGLLWISFFLTNRVGAQVVINEFLPDPSSENDATEWIELYNGGDEAVTLTGWQVDDEEGGSKPYALPEMLIAAKGFVIIHKAESNLGLNNGGDSVRLFNPEGVLVDSFRYTSTKVDVAYARIPDGVGDWQQTEMLTPGSTNQMIISTNPTTTVITAPARLKLSEVYACPGSGENEWVEVVATEGGSMEGYVIEDAGKNKLGLSGNIETQQYLAFEIKNSWLNNDGDTVSLKLPSGEVVERMSYPKCYPGRSYIFSGGSWVETLTPTKNSANRLTLPSPTLEKPTVTPKQTLTPKSSPQPSATIMVETGVTPELPAHTATQTSLRQATLAGVLSVATPESDSSSPAVLGAANTKKSGFVWWLLAGISFSAGGIWPFVKRFF
jgi:hypothetical protein